jgi:hypothetical protein
LLLNFFGGVLFVCLFVKVTFIGQSLFVLEILDTLSQTQQEKIRPSQVNVKPSHWSHENYGPKTICHHFLLGPIPLAQQHNLQSSLN